MKITKSIKREEQKINMKSYLKEDIKREYGRNRNHNMFEEKQLLLIR